MERIGKSLYNVAPLAGAWIEMPLRKAYNLVKTVAPLAGAWIEIAVPIYSSIPFARRSPRGSVD